MSPTRLSKYESAIRIVLAFNEAFNRRDVPGMMQLVSDDCVLEDTYPAPDGSRYVGKEAITEFLQQFFSESAEIQIEIEEIFGLGYRCVVLWRYEWVDVEGQRACIRGADIFQLKNDLICKKLSYVKGKLLQREN